MKLGISSFTYGWAVGSKSFEPEHPMKLMDLLNKVKEFNLSLLQIGDNIALADLDNTELIAAAYYAETNNIEIEIGMRGLFEDNLQKYLELCRLFNSKLLRVVIDLNEYKPNKKTIVEVLDKWAPLYKQEGITIGIENHDRFKAAELADIVNSVNSDNVGICLDTANSFGALEGTDAILREFLPMTVNFHAKDIAIKRLPSQQGFIIEGAVSGEGMLDIKSILKSLYESNSNINCILEQWTHFDGDIEETIKREAEEAEKGVINLKQILYEIESAS